MEVQEIIDTLRKFRRKWRREITREHKFQQDMRVKYPGNFVPGCYEKSVGIDIGYGSCTRDVDTLIKKLEHEQRTNHERRNQGSAEQGTRDEGKEGPVPVVTTKG